MTGLGDPHAARKRNAPHETPMRYFEAPDDRVSILQGQRASSTDSERVRLEGDLDLFQNNAR